MENNWPTIVLSGDDWKITSCLPGEFSPVTGINPQSFVESIGPDWITARVPGDVQSDALDAGLIPDPNYGLNSRSAEWTYQRDWVYSKTFTISRPALPFERVFLRFEGVDYQCDVFLNGKWLGRHEGAWTAFEYEITDQAQYDTENKLTVVVYHAPDEECQWGRTSKVKTLKARFAYGWDWCTRLVPLGIWKDVKLVARSSASILDVFARPVVDLKSGKAEVVVEIKTHAIQSQSLSIDLELSLNGKSVATKNIAFKQKEGEGIYRESLSVSDPQLWYPNGYGEQPIYHLSCGLKNRGQEVLDSRNICVGLRKLEWLRNEGASQDALPYTIRVNGKRIYIKGWNWSPIRQLYGRRQPEVYRRRLELARDAHCTLIRIWGGGLAERETFYNLCDQFGILVLQELFMSSACIDNHPSTDPAYVRLLTECARDVIVQKRNHPSLAVWCGGNELCVRGDAVDVHGNILRPDVIGYEGYKTDLGGCPWLPLKGDHPLLAALEKCVRTLDPDRHWLPSSASGPWENASIEYVGRMHDVHGPWSNLGPKEHYKFYNTVDMMLHGEFGCDGSASLQAIRRFVPPEYHWPMDDKNPIAWYHGRMWTGTNLKRTEQWFGEIDNLATYVRASQYVQAEGLRYGLEAHRRRKWQSSGAMPWHFAEPWPNVCDTCSVDVYDQPKPSYFAVARANRPIHVSARYDAIIWSDKQEFTAELWGHNSTDKPFVGQLATSLWSLEGRCLLTKEQAVSLEPEQAGRWDNITHKMEGLPELFLLYSILKDDKGTVVSCHWSVHSKRSESPLNGLRHLPETELTTHRKGNLLCVTNSGSVVAAGVWLETALDDHVRFSDNWLILVPGETAEIRIEGTCESIRISAWNVSEVKVPW
jgi:beta-mannosidase